MATASVPIEPNEKECSVCHEPFTEPKLLLCGHLLCRRCLVSWLKSQQDAHCPLCRCIIVDPKERESKSLDVIADGFPTDLAMKAVVDADRILGKEHTCCACEDAEATSMCLDCEDMLCKSCTKLHLKMSVSKHHVVEKLSSLTAGKLAANRQPNCAVHTDKTSEVFCPTHGASICLLCATTDHRQCPDVTKLETKMEEARATLAELAAILTAGERELERGIDQLDQHHKETEKRTQAAIDEIEAMCNRLESAVKACRRRLKELALNACSDVREAVNDGKTCLLTRRGRLTSHKRVIERVDDMKTRDAICDMTLVMQKRVGDLDLSTTLPRGSRIITTPTLVIDPAAVARVEHELAQLGQLQVTPTGVAHPRSPNPTKPWGPSVVHPGTSEQAGRPPMGPGVNSPPATTQTPARQNRYTSSSQKRSPAARSTGQSARTAQGPPQSMSDAIPMCQPLTAAMLAAAQPHEQRMMLGERLFPLVKHMYPEMAGKITGMLLERDNSELLILLQRQEKLKEAVEETVLEVQAHQMKLTPAAKKRTT